MKKNLLIPVAGLLLAVISVWLATNVVHRFRSRRLAAAASSTVCFSCFWERYDPKFREDFITFYRQYHSQDPLASGDTQYILGRATGVEACDARQFYRRVAKGDKDAHRRFLASAILGFSAGECGEDGSDDLKAAADLAGQIGKPSESALLSQIASGRLAPRYERVRIETSLAAPPGSSALILGETTMEVPAGLKAGVQVDRTARDWLSYQMRWDLTAQPLAASKVLDYHEGAVLRHMMSLAPLEVYPLAGSIVAHSGEKWFAPDENGVFRFEVLPDKMRYPTSHVSGRFAWIEDTHGISALVMQAMEKQYPLVLGCGDSQGKMEAAFYLAQKGVNVFFPGDRYQDLLLGYQAKGTLLGTAPVKKVRGSVIIGSQPVRFPLNETIVAQDTKALFPVQYYDAAARYFRRLSGLVPSVKVAYVVVDQPDQIGSVLIKANDIGSTAVAVRVATQWESDILRNWLSGSQRHRAILFHSGLYPYAQGLFEQFPNQVTFGDLHPRFVK